MSILKKNIEKKDNSKHSALYKKSIDKTLTLRWNNPLHTLTQWRPGLSSLESVANLCWFPWEQAWVQKHLLKTSRVDDQISFVQRQFQIYICEGKEIVYTFFVVHIGVEQYRNYCGYWFKIETFLMYSKGRFKWTFLIFFFFYFR